MTRGYREDFTGKKFGKLSVLEKVKINKHTHYLCECDCDNKTQKVCRSDNLKDGITTHCGCVNNFGTHRMTNSRLYNIWGGMKDRCFNVNNEQYNRYCGRGITICEEWLGIEGFQNFYDWANENGYEEDLTIDRINNNGNYEPDNCRWATMEVQANNTSKNNNIEINGITKSVSEWSRFSGISRYVIKQRYKSGVRGVLLFEEVIIPAAEYQSGVEGIKWDRSKKRWKSDLIKNKKVNHIGYYKLDDLERAIKEREEYIGNMVINNG